MNILLKCAIPNISNWTNDMDVVRIWDQNETLTQFVGSFGLLRLIVNTKKYQISKKYPQQYPFFPFFWLLPEKPLLVSWFFHLEFIT